jgi:hypothetical protein
MLTIQIMLAKSLHSANMQATEVCQHSSFGKHDTLEYHALPPPLKPILYHVSSKSLIEEKKRKK